MECFFGSLVYYNGNFLKELFKLMSLSGSNELPFWIDTLSCESKNCLYLSQVAIEDKGIKFSGGIPLLWEEVETKIIGPILYDEDHTYRVVDVDYRNNFVWLEEI